MRKAIVKRGRSGFHVCIYGAHLLLVWHALGAPTIPTPTTPTTPDYDRHRCIDDRPIGLEFGPNAPSRNVVIERGSVLGLYAFHLLDCPDLNKTYVYFSKDGHDGLLVLCNMTSNPMENTCSITCDVLVGNLQNTYKLYIEAFSRSLKSVVSTSFLIVHCPTQKGGENCSITACHPTAIPLSPPKVDTWKGWIVALITISGVVVVGIAIFVGFLLRAIYKLHMFYAAFISGIV